MKLVSQLLEELGSLIVTQRMGVSKISKSDSEAVEGGKGRSGPAMIRNLEKINRKGFNH